MPVLVVFPAAAKPYPGEVPVPVHEAGVAVPDPGIRADPEPAATETVAAAAEPDAERACSEPTKAGTPCKGRPGDDGLCAAHKKAAATS